MVTLYTIFLGPCEPLIPLLIYPAAQGGAGSVAIVATTFTVVTVAVMLMVVLLGISGAGMVKLKRLSGWEHILASAVILACGAAIVGGL